MFSIIPKSLCYPGVIRNSFIFKNHGKDPFQVPHRNQSRTKGDKLIRSMVKGIDYLRSARLNRGLAFTLKERQALGINGILACSFKSQREQLDILRTSLDRFQNNLNKYLFLTELLDTNERLYYSLLCSDIDAFLPLVYTPTVGLACQKFGFAYRRPMGLFLSIHDMGHIEEILNNWPEDNVRAICFTDGERILGLGDLGAFGMGIPIGKLSLYTALAHIKPSQCLPITLDVGTNNKNLLEDPLYIGIREKRVTGKKYFDFIAEFMQACVNRFGPNTLLQFEDFALHTATPLLHTYIDKYCTFNDDIQGTASVAIAGLFSASRITKMKITQQVHFFLGAGSAACGIANLIITAMVEQGLSEKDALEKVYLFDVHGLLTTKRKEGVPPHAKKLGRDLEPEKNFEAAIKKYKPTTLIGCSTVGGAFNENVLKMMASHAERPIIFALSNPTSKAECTAQQAYDGTEGRCIFASGSPFPPVKYNGKEYHTGQGNNAYIFPGLALGVLITHCHRISDLFFLEAAKTLANIVSQDDLDIGRIYPPLCDVPKVSMAIAEEIAKLGYKTKFATLYPEPKDIKKLISQEIYKLEYPPLLPGFYDYPPPPTDIKVKSAQEMYPTGPLSKAPVKGKPKRPC